MNKIAIIGFGGAGYCAAEEARKRDPEAVIDVYSDTGLGPYNPMLTTYYVKGAIPYEAMFPYGTLEEARERLNLTVHTNRPVTGLDPAARTLRFADGSQAAYDNILISTGASAVMPPLPGMDLPGVIKMRTVQDAVDLKERLDSGKIRSGLVIGSSWVGIKVVEDLVTRDIPCTLIDGAPWMFYVASFQESAQRVQADLEAKGVTLSFNQMLDHIEQESDGRLTAVTQSGSRFTADLIAVCIGVRTNTGFLKDSGVAMNRGVLVDRRMSTNYPGVYAAGDCCEAVDIQSGAHRNIGVWYNAQKQGQVAGANMAGGEMEFDANVLVNLAHYLDYDFISIGDVSTCGPEDTVYEYEDNRYYIRGVRDDSGIKCLNVIGSAESNGLLKNIFIKSIESPGAGMDIQSVCYLKDKGFPDSFIDFLGGKTVD